MTLGMRKAPKTCLVSRNQADARFLRRVQEILHPTVTPRCIVKHFLDCRCVVTQTRRHRVKSVENLETRHS